MESSSMTKSSEESLEEKLDKINSALQNTMQELDVSVNHTRGYSIISCLHSYTNSYCFNDVIDEDCDKSEKSEENVQETIEGLLISLDRSQMVVEDFLAENYRKLKKISYFSSSNYIKSLEQENKTLKKNQIQILHPGKNPKLEQERKNFEEKLAELDHLVSTYKTKHTQITVLEENLRTKESLLEQKEKQLKQLKSDLEHSKKKWEESVINNTVRTSLYEGKKSLTIELGAEEAPPPKFSMTPNRLSDLQILQQTLRLEEIKYRNLTDPAEQSKLVVVIDQLKNKIAALRGQQAMMNCRNSCKVMTEMKKTIEKEVNYEEFLRKSHLGKFSVKGNGIRSPTSFTPSYSTLNSKKFLFTDE